MRGTRVWFPGRGGRGPQQARGLSEAGPLGSRGHAPRHPLVLLRRQGLGETTREGEQGPQETGGRRLSNGSAASSVADRPGRAEAQLHGDAQQRDCRALRVRVSVFEDPPSAVPGAHRSAPRHEDLGTPLSASPPAPAASRPPGDSIPAAMSPHRVPRAPCPRARVVPGPARPPPGWRPSPTRVPGPSQGEGQAFQQRAPRPRGPRGPERASAPHVTLVQEPTRKRRQFRV